MADQYADFGGDTAPTYADLGGDTSSTGDMSLEEAYNILSGSGSSSGSSSDWLSSLLGLGATGIKSLLGAGGGAGAGIAGALLGGLAGNASWAQPQVQKTGYQGGIPSYTAVREQVPGTYDPNRRAGSGGQQYFTDMKYVSPTDVATAKATAAEEAKAIEAKNKANPARQPVAEYAAGGLANLAKGRYLSGATDGMEDRLPATIDNKQPAKLSHGEFVVSADCVSALGGGNSEAGAQRLYDMMDRIRMQAHGKKSQMKPVNPKKVLPA